jgi:hypothetical protein|tara:strand:+ start:1328 stop:1714 length:387 start_codon:yes stop_codon:yes gene_type:complete
MKIEVSIGEVVDKITILQIKKEKISDELKLEHVEKELTILESTLKNSKILVPEKLIQKLKDVNLKLWDAEDVIRDRENKDLFDEEFIKCARLDAKLNDERFLVKNEINNVCQSNIKEQKSYEGLYSAN